MQTLATARTQTSIITRKRMVEVTPNFELAKPRGLCVHTSANFEWDHPRLVVCRTNLKILSWFRNPLEVNFKLRNHGSSTRTLNFKLT